jgi:hypothetical protein
MDILKYVYLWFTFLNIHLDSSSPGQGPVIGCCEHGGEPSRSLSGGEFCDWLGNFLGRTLVHGVGS